MHEHAETPDELRGEIERLRGRVQELEAALRERAPGEEAQRDRAPQVPYQALFEKLPVPLAIHRADGRKIAENERFLALAGGSREEIAGRDLPSTPSEREGGVADAFARAARGECVRMPPAQCHAAEAGSGRGAWSEATYFPISGEDGQLYIGEVNMDVTDRTRAEGAARDSSAMLFSIVDNSPLLIYVKDLDGRYLLLNQRTASLINMKWEDVKGKTDHDLFPKEVADSFKESDHKVISSEGVLEREELFPTPDGVRHFVTNKFPFRDADGRVCGVSSISTDITAHKLAEAENRRLQDEIIRVQEETLRALSTPLMPIAKGVVVMPLIGNLDRTRAAHVLEALLKGVSTHQATNVILDITGVPVVDADVANSLIRTAQALKLIGARVVLTGIQPTIAQTLVTLGTDLKGIVTKSTLENGIDYVLKS